MGDTTAHRTELVTVSNAELSPTTHLAWEGNRCCRTCSVTLVVVEHWSLLEDAPGVSGMVIVAGLLSPNRSTRLLIYVPYEIEMVWAL